MKASPQLPPELWLEIFGWATISPARNYSISSEPWPFRRVDDFYALATKRSLVLVCKTWRTLANRFLYEAVIIRKDVSTLKKALEGGFARLVQLAELHSRANLVDAQVLNHCPNLRLLVNRSYVCSFQTLPNYEDLHRISLPSVRRMYWWHNLHGDHIGLLAAVLMGTPNIDHLFVSGGVQADPAFFPHPPAAFLPNLTTLSLSDCQTIGLEQICRFQLPRLTRVCVRDLGRWQSLDVVWETFGHQLNTVEFGSCIRYLIDDCVTGPLRMCPVLETLKYYVHFTLPLVPIHHSTLKHIGLHGLSTSFDGPDAKWEQLESHFRVFAGPSFPALQDIVLYGEEWEHLIRQDRFRSLLGPIYLRNCVVRLEDGTILEPGGKSSRSSRHQIGVQCKQERML